MQIDKREGSLLITVGKRGVCVFRWDGITKLEIEDALKVIQEFVALGKPNFFTEDGERTKRRITVQFIPKEVPVNYGENHKQMATELFESFF